jgi:hypothetical protein
LPLDLLGDDVTAPAQDATPLAFRRAAPNAVFDAIEEGVLETLAGYRARRADSLRGLDARAVGRKELGGVDTTTPCVKHPRVLVGGFFHGHLPFNVRYGCWVPSVHIVSDTPADTRTGSPNPPDLQPFFKPLTFERAVKLLGIFGPFLQLTLS